MKPLKLFLLFLVLLVIASGVASVVVVRTMLQPVNPSNSNKIRFVVPKGQSISKIGDRLTEAGLIKHPLVFRFLVKKLNAEKEIQAGSFSLSPNMTPEQLITEMTKGTDDVWVTLLEGWRREEMANSLATQDLAHFDKQEFLRLTDGKEGYLFPDTYLVQREFTTEQIISLLKNTFKKKVEDDLADQITASGRSLKDIITMASIIQREAKGEEQMRLVSGVLWKRVDLGMGLNVDSTLQYLRGYNLIKDSWWVPPLAVDKESTSPYNTYKHAGLPPGPIANPGLDAIEAALHPTQTEYLYYLHDAQGQIHFGRTLEEHNANVQKYLR